MEGRGRALRMARAGAVISVPHQGLQPSVVLHMGGNLGTCC